ncbi:MAG: hypothetical protein ABR861_17025 [Terriglobales bacterium]|jgi:hypothetical protein
MAITNLFSKRQKALRKEVPDVYQYDVIPPQLRAQVVHILRDLFGFVGDYDLNGCLKTFKQISDILCREYGVFCLSSNAREHIDSQVVDFLLNRADHEQVIDTIETSFSIAKSRIFSNSLGPQIPSEKLEDAIAEVNIRFREGGVGYQYESGEMIRVDSQLIHIAIVKPALMLLRAKEYAGANAEFLKAFEHYRKGDTKECLNECLKAFESTMKVICKKRGWAFKQTDTASTLIEVCYQNGLIPALI